MFELDQRLGVVAAVAVGHLGAVPERVDVAVAVVHAGPHAGAVVEDAVTAEDILVVVERLGGAVVRVHAGAGPVRLCAVAPHVVCVGEQRAGTAGGLVEVGRVVVAAGGVLHLVPAGAAVVARGDRHLAGVDAVAGAGLDLVVGPAGRTGGGVDQDMQPARCLVGPGAGDDHVPGQSRRAAGRVHDEAGAGAGDLPGQARHRDGGGPRPGDLRRDGYLHRTGQALGDVPQSAGRRQVHDDIATEHGQATVGAVVPHVAAAVPVEDDPPAAEAVALNGVHGGRVRGDGRGGPVENRCARARGVRGWGG